jgi:hypothetical protein
LLCFVVALLKPVARAAHAVLYFRNARFIVSTEIAGIIGGAEMFGPACFTGGLEPDKPN